MRLLAVSCIVTAALSYPGAPPVRRDLSWSTHWASSENDPALPALPVWPLPASASFPSGAPGAACLTPFFSIFCAAGAPCPDPLASAFDRYSGFLSFAGAPVPLAAGAPAVTALTVRVGQVAPLALRVSENYTLSVPSGVGNDTVAVLTADTQWGALRGLETFSQLFIWSGRGVPVSCKGLRTRAARPNAPPSTPTRTPKPKQIARQTRACRWRTGRATRGAACSSTLRATFYPSPRFW